MIRDFVHSYFLEMYLALRKTETQLLAHLRYACSFVKLSDDVTFEFMTCTLLKLPYAGIDLTTINLCET
jgi:hypothetical protein